MYTKVATQIQGSKHEYKSHNTNAQALTQLKYMSQQEYRSQNTNAKVSAQQIQKLQHSMNTKVVTQHKQKKSEHNYSFHNVNAKVVI